ncbi:hypothetical protein [Spirosoma fluviale]|uniref:Uncharacterized protein n=1 Tax=Spirosoma fluviale TaxID=1597977 RepID=A0A286GKZ1_9BACT|nr:hypothetical protein [Spirosoma fluviale]SOD95856.1 hypothetical protein SAMN06269250_5016 [Spirosoma fluviale]
MTDEQLSSARTDAANEPEPLPADLYTPMTKEEWESNMAIYERVLGYVLGDD